jgi:hypothetical protein
MSTHHPHALTSSHPDTYTANELMRCSLWCLQKFSGTLFVYVGLRDAAMLLFSTTTAVRGGSSRILRWSDLFVSQIPMDDVCLGKKVPVSCKAGHMCSDQCFFLLYRSFRLSRTMPNTTNKDGLMNTAPSDTVWWSSALSAPFRG